MKRTVSGPLVDLLYREPHFLVVNKPPGVYSQPNWWTENVKAEGATTIETLMRQQYPELFHVRPPFCGPKLVHRLDHNTTGAMIMATSVRSAKMFARGFQSRGGYNVRKFYLGLLQGEPVPDSSVEWIVQNVLGMAKSRIQGKFAATRFHIHRDVPVRSGTTLCAFEILTGRKRQIRDHAANLLGAPLCGDDRFGAKDPTPSIALHASKLLIDLGVRTVEVDAPIQFNRGAVWGLDGPNDAFPDTVFDELRNWRQ